MNPLLIGAAAVAAAALLYLMRPQAGAAQNPQGGEPAYPQTDQGGAGGGAAFSPMLTPFGSGLTSPPVAGGGSDTLAAGSSMGLTEPAVSFQPTPSSIAPEGAPVATSIYETAPVYSTVTGDVAGYTYTNPDTGGVVTNLGGPHGIQYGASSPAVQPDYQPATSIDPRIVQEQPSQPQTVAQAIQNPVTQAAQLQRIGY